MLQKNGDTWLIVGLGNPGREYERSRHNCGFRAVDILAEKLGCKIDRAKFQGLYGQTTYKARTKRTDTLMSAEVAATLKNYMRNNVQTIYGDWNFGGLNVCAKSGTSQLGGDEISNAMFAGFVADEAYPLAFMVVVENGGYGATACVPVIAPVLTACREVLDGK